MPMPMKLSSSLWAQCILASLALHSAALYLALKTPLLLKDPLGSFFSYKTSSPTLIQADEDWSPDHTVLEHFFEEIPLLPPKKLTLLQDGPFPLEETKGEIQISSSFPKPLSTSFYKTIPSFPVLLPHSQEEEDSLLPVTLEVPLLYSRVSSPTSDGASLLEQELPPLSPLQQEQPLPSISLSSFPTREPPSIQQSFSQDPASLEEHVSTLPNPTHFLPSFNDKTPSLPTQPPPSFQPDLDLGLLSQTSFANIEDYLPDELVCAMQWNDNFYVETSYLPDEDGYIFSLTIHPKSDLQTQRIKQNFYFLIDASSEMEKHKISVFKRAVLKALAALSAGDSFNILFLDKKTTKLSALPLPVSPQSYRLAEDFLTHQEEGRSFFSSLNLYESLTSLLDKLESPDEVHTAFLLTNGKSSSANSTQELRQFLSKNKGKLTLFTAAIGQSNNLFPLDMLSSLCGGKLLYSDTNAAFPRKLATLVKDLQTPLARNLSCTLYAAHPKAQVQLTSFSGSNLYNQAPFMILGKVDRLCDLHLIMQGKSLEDHIFLKKVIHLEEEISSKPSLKKEWVSQQKTKYYEKFLQDAKPSHLKQAKEILQGIYGKALIE